MKATSCNKFDSEYSDVSEPPIIQNTKIFVESESNEQI